MFDRLVEPLSRYMPLNAAIIASLALLYLVAPSVGLVIKLVIPRLLNRHRRKLLWRVFHRVQLPRVGRDKLTMYAGDKEISDAGVVIFDVRSTGQEAISPADLSGGKMALTFGEAQVESHTLLESLPSNLDLNVNAEGNRLELSADFFNRGDAAKFQVVLSNYDAARDKIDAPGRLKEGKIRLVEWDQPGHVDEWGKAFLSAFVVLLGAFHVLFVIGLQMRFDYLPAQLVLAAAMSLVITATHCWVATEGQRAEEEHRAFGDASGSTWRQAWAPPYIFAKWLFTSRFYRRMFALGLLMGMMPYLFNRLNLL